MDRERLENGLKILIVALEEPYCWGPQRLQGRSGTLKANGCMGQRKQTDVAEILTAASNGLAEAESILGTIHVCLGTKLKYKIPTQNSLKQVLFLIL